MLPGWDNVASILRCALWVDVQAALWSAMLLAAAAIASRLLRGRLPVWRKGVWLAVMLAPAPIVLIAALMPPDRSLLVPIDWLRIVQPLPGDLPATTGPLHAAAAVFLAWIILNLLVEAVATLRVHQLIRRSVAVQSHRIVQLYTLLARRMGFSRAPRLVSSTQTASPFIFGSLFSGPTIVLPEALVSSPGAGRSLRAVLAHELAHARAADPFVQRLLGLLRCFLPLTWLCALGASRRFWEDAAEQTGDLRAVHAASLSDAEYASVLKDLALGQDGPGMALAFSGPGQAMAPQTQRLAAGLLGRLRALRMAAGWSESAIQGASAVRAILLAAVLFGLASRPHLRGLLRDPRSVAASPPAAPIIARALPEAPPPARPILKERTPESRSLQSAVELKFPKDQPPRREEKALRKDDRPIHKHRLNEALPRPNKK